MLGCSTQAVRDAAQSIGHACDCGLGFGLGIAVALQAGVREDLHGIAQFVVEFLKRVLLTLLEGEQQIDGNGGDDGRSADRKNDGPERRNRVLSDGPVEDPIKNEADTEIENGEAYGALNRVLAENPGIE